MTLTCTACETAHSPHELQTVCRQCGAPLRADYFFAPEQFTPDDLPDLPSLWRWEAFLPSVPDMQRVSLGEANTPLLEREVQGRRVYLKDETANPTGSFKDRGMCAAVSLAKALGVQRVWLPSAGNAGVSAAAYALAAGLECQVTMPENIPQAFVDEARESGAEVLLAGRTISEAAAAGRAALDVTWFDLSTFREPYRVEGKKTLGLEIAEQLEWDFPDVVVYPTGGGTGLLGMWKAFQELASLDWVRRPLPRMVTVQMEGCAPVVRAFEEGRTTVEPWPDPATAALGLNVPAPMAGAWILRVLRESRGRAVAVAEDSLGDAQQELQELSGVAAGPESAAAWLGLKELMAEGWIGPEERAVVVITGDDRRYG